MDFNPNGRFLVNVAFGLVLAIILVIVAIGLVGGIDQAMVHWNTLPFEEKISLKGVFIVLFLMLTMFVASVRKSRR